MRLRQAFLQLHPTLISRHLRRAKARYRLHRIEWNGRHRPLEPPKGYEKYYTLEEMFPGFKDQAEPIRNFTDFKEQWTFAWKLYVYHYFPHKYPEMAEFERRTFPEEYEEEQRLKKQSEILVEEAEQKIDDIKDHTKQFAQDVKEEWQRQRPHAEHLVQDRANLVKVAVKEFSEGFQEAISGKYTFRDFLPVKQFYKETAADDDFEIPETDNLPLRYECINQEHETSETIQTKDVSKEKEFGK